MKHSYLLTAVMVLAGACNVFAAPVSHVSVDVTAIETPMPPLVQKRVSASIQTVGNHIFINQDDGAIQNQYASYERTVTDIINRVLIGYTVEDIRITPGPDTHLAVRIRPWGETIKKVNITVDYGSLPLMGWQAADKDLIGVRAFVENLLLGLPVDSLDWANGTIRSVMENELSAMLPEFYPHITITAGPETDVKIYFMPQLPVVRNVNVTVEAENLPKVIFLNTRRNLEMRYAGLEGLPVAFVRRHEREFMADLQDSLSHQWVIKQYKLRVLPSLDIGENMNIHLKSETDFYDIRAGAYIDMNRDDRRPGSTDRDEHTVLAAHVGRKVGQHHEFYSELEFRPTSVKWNFIPGYFYRWGKFTTMGYQFETTDDSNHLWLRQQLGGRWMLRFDRDLTNRDDEFGLAYRLHEYISLEYIISDHDNWLRIIGHL